MSQNEQSSVIGETLMRYQEGKKALCCLETKARKIADGLQAMSAMLQDVPESDSPFQYNPKLVPEFSSHKEVYDLICEIEKTRDEIAKDRKSLSGMGVQFPID